MRKGKGMDVYQAIRSRRSIRAFSDKPVEDEKLARVLAAGRLAPSARNMQEWKFVVVRDRTMRRELAVAAKNQFFVCQAPVVIVACGTIADYVMRCGQLSYPIDVAIAVTQMTLQAVEEGLGTCWVCAFEEAKVKAALAVPDDARVVTLLPLGYPAEAPEARMRKATDEIFCYERYT